MESRKVYPLLSAMMPNKGESKWNIRKTRVKKFNTIEIEE